MRLLTAALLCLSMVSIVDGDLLRPCTCGQGDVPACGCCPADLAGAAPPKAPSHCKHCCGCDKAKDDQRPADKPEGCKICPGPREPRDGLADLAVALETPAPGFLDAPSFRLDAGDEHVRVLGERPAAMPRDGPWRCSPEGLSVFLT